MEISKLKKVGSTHIGQWVDEIPIRGLEDLKLKVRAIDNVDAIILRTNLIRALALEDGDEISKEDIDRIEVKVLVDAIVVDWNVTADQVPVPFTKDALTELLTDPEAGPLMVEACRFASNVVVNRALRDLESAEKNSETP